MTPNIIEAKAEFYDRATTSPEMVAYLRQHSVDPLQAMPYAGGIGRMTIWDCGADRFDFVPHLHAPDEGFDAVVCEVLDIDGETAIDLVAWDVAHPARVFTMFGAAAAVGLWEAGNPATYYLGKSLVLHRTPLDWLKAGCRGAAIVDRKLAGRWLLDLLGPVAARDQRHAREVDQLYRSVVVPDRIRVAMPDDERIAA